MAPHGGHVSGSVPLPLAELSYFSVLAATSGPVEARHVLQLVRFYECRFCAGAGSVGALVGVWAFVSFVVLSFFFDSLLIGFLPATPLVGCGAISLKAIVIDCCPAGLWPAEYP